MASGVKNFRSKVAGLGLVTMAWATPLGAAEPQTNTDVAAKFTIYVGGMLILEGNFGAQVSGDTYALSTDMATAGTIARFFPATYKLRGEGEIREGDLVPEKFVSDQQSKRETRLMTLTYGADRMPHARPVPAFEPEQEDEIKEITPDMRRATSDPISAFLMPVKEGVNPCDRKVQVFDGRRRYNLTFAYQQNKMVTPPDASKPKSEAVARDTLVCTVIYEAIAPADLKRRMEKTKRRQDDMRVWFAPFDGGRIYMPVRFELRTPIGMAVMELQNLTEIQMAANPSSAPKQLAQR